MKPLLTSLCLATLMFSGCRTKSDAARERESSHLRSLISVFNFATAKLGHRPANEAEFKSFISANARPMIDSLHLADVNELFVSERDGQPFVVLYGTAPNGAARDLIAYEQTGVASVRLVGYSLGAIAEVDERQFSQLVPQTPRPAK